MKQPHINSRLISFLFTWFGLVPYKLYEGPGMLIAIVQMIVLQTIIPLQVHLIPHFFSLPTLPLGPLLPLAPIGGRIFFVVG